MDACDLAACPVCGKAVFENHSEVFCGDELCVYMTATVDLHNTLARRAEIGRIVEAIVGNENMLDVYRATLGGPPLFTVRGFGGTSANGPTLLDALRALEAEVGGRDEPEGGPAL